MKQKMIYVALGAVWAALLGGCRHKELCYDHPHGVEVSVIFDWSAAPDATPETMSLYLYPTEGGKPLRYEFIDCNGGKIRVPLGNYHAMCLNSSTEYVTYRNTEQLETFEVFTRTTPLLAGMGLVSVRSENAPRPEGTENERVAQAPDRLWSGYVKGIELQEIEGQEIRMVPRLSTSYCTIEIRNAENLGGVASMSGTLSGTSESLFPGQGSDKVGETPITIPFGVTIWPDEKKVTAEHAIFGHCPGAANAHMLTIYAILSDNSQWYQAFDVTEQLHTAADQRRIHIVLDGLTLPVPDAESGGGFQPTVDGWKDAEEDLVIDM